MDDKSEQIKKGKILSGIGGLYTVLTDDGELISCKPRGSFRHYELSPYPGDNVTVRVITQGEAMISEILPRKNFIKRPPVANIDKLFVTVAAADPSPAYITVDKLICVAEFYDITPVIIVTKADLDAAKAEEIKNIYTSCGFDVFVTSSRIGEGIEALKSFVYSHAAGSTSAFAGESGVGKSSLMNKLFSSLLLKTGETSRINRGKHTTRAATLYRLDEMMDHYSDNSSETRSAEAKKYFGSFIADTPGFGMIEPSLIAELTKNDLPLYFREFTTSLTKCRYTKCTHLREEGCEIINAVENGNIPKSRHESYVTIYEELKKRKTFN